MLLQAVDLTVSYARGRGSSKGGARASGAPLALNNVSLTIARGSLLGILGPNGSGKTTLLRLLAGTLAPDTGQVLLDGTDVRRIARGGLAKRFAVVPQETQLAFEYTALEIALMGRYPHLSAFEIEGPRDLESALAALEATGTRELAGRRFQTLSGGEKQRVVIASALAQLDRGTAVPGAAGAVLLLDEPTASLDLRYQIEIAALIRRLHDRRDVSIVLTTHDVHFARAVCDEVVLLRGGEILARGPSADVLTIARLNELYGVDVSSALSEAFI